MAEFLWTFAVQEVLKNIVKFGAEQIRLAWGMEQELYQLKQQLQKAAAILADINTKKSHPDSVRLWVEQLQDIVYEADDLLDELVYEDLRRTVGETGKFRKVRDYISLSKNPFLFRSDKAKKMKNITQTLDKHHCAASSSVGLVGVEFNTETEVALNQIRETTSILDVQVEGREAEVLELLKLVIDSTNEHNLSVIPIVGMGGLGKTTLAKLIFNHDVIKQHFDKTIWVCVSKPFIVMKILEEIFQGLKKTGSGLDSKDVLLQRLREEMGGKKYFLVLDDVWEDMAKGLWDDLSHCLKHIAGKSGSIMVTTRSVEVATMVKSVSIHHLKQLSDNQCWALFKESANANQLQMNSKKLENMKKELVRKMGGVPLVAKVLGGAAKFEKEGDYESWMAKVESIATNISTDDKDFVMPILKLSVDSLPRAVLKQCFAYCSNFPQDYNFKIDELIQMWIAEGFIQPQQESENLIMEDIGEGYFNFLLSRSLFQDVQKDENGRIVGFKMHDLIHDIACMASKHQKKESNPNNLSGKIARKLRTFIVDDEVFPSKVLHDDLVGLRVLILDLYSFNKWPIVSLNKLIHLRYLDMSRGGFRYGIYLEHISLFYNLQTLKLGHLVNISLPKNLRKLVNLRHLSFDKIFSMKQMPSHMGNLIHLQTLSEFSVGLEKGCKIEELGPLKNLKGTLKLRNMEKVQSKEEAMAAKLVEKKNLSRLIFEWSDGEYVEDNNVQVLEGLQPHKNLIALGIIGFQGKALANSIFVENLVSIRLDGCERCEVLPMLGQLPNLKKLEIISMNSVRSIGNEFYGIDTSKRNSFAFPRLEILEISGMKKLKQWDEASIIASNLYGCLRTLYISGCDELAKLPSGLKGCHSIEYLKIWCPNLMGLNVQNLHNLYHLDVCGLKRLPEGLDEMSNLKELIIRGCMQNYEFSSFIHLSSHLIELQLTDDGWSRDNTATTQLPQQLQHLTNLKVLAISNFDGIEALPEWLENLTSLTTLRFCNCRNLKKLPSKEAMLRLTKLEKLECKGCPKLLLEKGDQERDKLSHLPSNCVRQRLDIFGEFLA